MEIIADPNGASNSVTWEQARAEVINLLFNRYRAALPPKRSRANLNRSSFQLLRITPTDTAWHGE